MSFRSLCAAEEEFLRKFFERLTAAGIRWMLMRNYEGFPSRVGNDIDVYFPRSDYRAAAALFREVLAGHGGEVLHRHQRDYVMAIWFRLPGGPPLHLDFYHGVTTWHGLHYLGEDELWNNRRFHDGWPVPRPAHEAMTLLVTSVLWGGFYKDRYASRIGLLLADPAEREAFDGSMQQAFGPAAALVFDPATSVAQPERDRAWGKRLQDGLRATCRRRDPAGSLFRQARYWLGEMKTLFRPPGPCLVVLDSDQEPARSALPAFIEEASHLFGGVVRVDHGPHLQSWKCWLKQIRLKQAKDSLVLVCVAGRDSMPPTIMRRSDAVLDATEGAETMMARLLDILRAR